MRFVVHVCVCYFWTSLLTQLWQHQNVTELVGPFCDQYFSQLQTIFRLITSHSHVAETWGTLKIKLFFQDSLIRWNLRKEGMIREGATSIFDKKFWKHTLFPGTVCIFVVNTVSNDDDDRAALHYVHSRQQSWSIGTDYRVKVRGKYVTGSVKG